MPGVFKLYDRNQAAEFLREHIFKTVGRVCLRSDSVYRSEPAIDIIADIADVLKTQKFDVGFRKFVSDIGLRT